MCAGLFFHPLTHQILLSIYCVPGAVPGTGATAANCFLSSAALRPMSHESRWDPEPFGCLGWIVVGVGSDEVSSLVSVPKRTASL